MRAAWELKQLMMGQRVSGCVGPLVTNPNKPRNEKFVSICLGMWWKNLVQGATNFSLIMGNFLMYLLTHCKLKSLLLFFLQMKLIILPSLCWGLFSDLLKNQKARKRILMMKSQTMSKETPRQRKGRVMSCLLREEKSKVRRSGKKSEARRRRTTMELSLCILC